MENLNMKETKNFQGFQFYKFVVEEGEEAQRLDTYLVRKFTELNNELSRSRIKKLIEEEMIKVNEKLVKPSYKIKKGDVVEVVIPPKEELELEPEDVPFNILYEDEHIVVINKPAGVVVHPAPGHFKSTLVHGLLKKLKNLSGVGDKLRPGIVHRLDKDTSGVMIVAKNDIAHKKLIAQFKNRKIYKEYLTICFGVPEKKVFKVSANIARHPVNRKKMGVFPHGREAETLFEVKEEFKKASLILAKPLTGRTHQIRVHLSYIGHPILGDPLYGGLKHGIPLPQRLMLHAYKISFLHPITGETLTFSAPIPQDFEDYLKILKKIFLEH